VLKDRNNDKIPHSRAALALALATPSTAQEFQTPADATYLKTWKQNSARDKDGFFARMLKNELETLAKLEPGLLRFEVSST
jgi:hypothetical protein